MDLNPCNLTLSNVVCEGLVSVERRRIENSVRKGNAVGQRWHKMKEKLKKQLNDVDGVTQDPSHFPCFVQFSAPFLKFPLITKVDSKHVWKG